MATNVGAIEVTFSGDSKSLDSASSKATASLKKFESVAVSTTQSAGRQFEAAGLRATAMGAAIGLAFRQMLTDMVSLRNTARDLSVGEDVLSRWQFAATKSAVSTEALSTALQSLKSRMTERGEFDAGPEIFYRLGISVQNAKGQIKPLADILPQLADKFANMKDSAAKTTLAMQLFGTTEILPFLNNAAAGLAEFGKQADKAGQTVDADKAKRLADFSFKLQAIWDAAKLYTADTFLQMEGGIGKIVGIIASGWGHLERFDKWLKDTREEVGKSWGESFGKMWERLAPALTSASVAMSGLPMEETGTRLSGLAAAARAAGEAVKTLVPPGGDAWNTWATTVTKAAAQVNAPIIKTAEEMQKAKEAADKFNHYMLEDLLNDKKGSFSNKFDQLDSMVRRGAISFREFGAAVKDVSEQQRDAMTETASMAATALTTIFKDNKAAAIASAIINTAVGVTKAIATYPPPYSFIMAGLQTAMGVAQIAAIKSTSQSGGGSVAPVSAASAPPPAAVEAPTQSKDSTLTVSGISKSDFFDAATVKALVKKMNGMQQDGVRLVIA